MYHIESMNAEAKLREAERQEEKRAGRSAAAAPATTTTEAGPLRKTSLKKGSRLVEKVGLGSIGLSVKAMAPGLCPFESLALTGACWEVVHGGGKQGRRGESHRPLARV